MARRLVQIALGTVLVVVMLAWGAVAWLAWYPESLKPPLERLLTARLGQPVAIAGPLRVDLGRITTVDLQGLRIGAPDWARSDTLLTVDRLRIGADVWAYLRHGEIRVSELVLAVSEGEPGAGRSEPDHMAGSAGEPRQAAPMPRLSLGRIEITDGSVALADAATDVDLLATFATNDRTGTGIGLRLDGRGRVRSDELDFELRLGSLQQAAARQGPLPVDGSLSLADTQLTLTGAIHDPAILEGIDLQLSLLSEDPSNLLALAGLKSAGSPPPLAANVQLTGGGRSFAAKNLQLSWGESSIEGDVAVDLAGPEPRLDGRLHAPVIDLASMPALDSSAAEPPNVPTANGNPLQAIAGYQGRVELTIGSIVLPSGIRLADARLTADLDDGRLTMPLRVGLPQGALDGELIAGPLGAEELDVATRLTASGAGVAGLLGEGYAGTIDGTLEGTVFVGATPDMLQRSRLRFVGRAAELAVPQAVLGSLDLTAVLEDGRLRLDPLLAKLPEGEVAGRVMAGPFDAGFTADIDLQAKGIDLGAAARTEGVAGQLDGSLAGTVRGAAPLDMLTRSTLRLVGTIAGLTLPTVEQRIATAEIDASLDPERREALRLVVTAEAGDRPLRLTAFGGSFATLVQNRGEYPVTIVSDLGRNEIEINGTVTLPLTERRFAATVTAAGPDPSPILALFDLPKLQIPPYRLEGRLTNRGSELRIRDFDGRVGDSDVTSDLDINFDGTRPRISGTVRSRLLDADDLGGLVGITPATGPGETASSGQVQEARQIEGRTDVLPNERIDPTRWRRVDLDLAVRADQIRAGKLPLDGFVGQVTMEDGLLRIEDMDLRIGDGHLTGRIEADGRRSPVGGEVSLDLQRVSVARLLNRLDVDAAAFGTLSGQAQGGVGLGGQGRSIKEILARSDGRVQLMMEGGRIDRTIVAALGLDLLRLVGAASGATPDTVEMRCALADLTIRDGLVTTDPLVIDTEIADLGGRGSVNLADESVDISLTARPKETPLLTDLTGISIGGRLGSPEIAINPVALVARGVAAATLGIVSEAIHGHGRCYERRDGIRLRPLARGGCRPERPRRLAGQIVDQAIVVGSRHAWNQHGIDQPPQPKHREANEPNQDVVGQPGQAMQYQHRDA